jgi:Flavodoxin
MRALIIYESMYGNTHAVANHIADGLQPPFDVTVATVEEATPDLVAQCDLLVCGGPTHMHGMSSGRSRQAAIAGVGKDDGDLALDDAAAGTGLRDWFRKLEHRHGQAAAFDTRIDVPAGFSGRASLGIARRLRHHGYELVVSPESFLVDKQSRLCPGEAERATAWAAALGATLLRAEQQLR